VSETSRVRAAVVVDASAVAVLSTELGYPQSATDAQRRLLALLADDDHLVLVAEAETGAVVGWLHARYSIELVTEPLAEIVGLTVTSSSRRQGHGGALVAGVVDWARSKRAAELWVRARVERLGTPAFYERHGFALDKTQNVFVRKLSAGDGRPEA
jgi:ribosomal protein S18 acetylase RimI-like enzyme